MKKKTMLKITCLSVLLSIVGCSSKISTPEEYSGFLKDYSDLKETASASGESTLLWIEPTYNKADYDTLVYHPIIYYPMPELATQIDHNLLNSILGYTNSKIKAAIGYQMNIVEAAGPRSLIFRGAITGVISNKEGIQFYEVIPVALIIACAQIISGHRTMDTFIYFEAEIIEAKTGKTIMKVARKGEGNELNNEKSPMTLSTFKKVIDDMAADVSKFRVKRPH